MLVNVRAALVVPEYRTEVAPGGGVCTVADFVLGSLSVIPGWSVDLVSPRMWSCAAESQRIRSPRSWLRGPGVSQREVDGRTVTYVGAHFAEIESLRFRPRRVLTKLLAPYDVVVVVAGTPAMFEVTRELDVPVLGQVATTVKVERVRLVMKGTLWRRAYALANRGLTYRLDRSGVRLPRLVLAENPWMAQWCRAHGARDVQIALPGVETDFFCPSPTRKTGLGFILSVGRLDDPRKDFGLLLRAYSHAVHSHGVMQRLVLAGRNDLDSSVYKILVDLGLERRVEVRSNLSRDELRDTYREADIFVMASSEEGLGMVLVEALASGVPIVSTATEGAKSIQAATGTGTLIPFGDLVEEDLGDALAAALADAESLAEQRLAARAAAVEFFSLERAGDRFRGAAVALLKAGLGD